jgi:cell wall-associated NlpC family hydrolase
MTFEPAGITAVQGRIAALQAQFGQFTVPPAQVAPSASTAKATSFDSALTDAEAALRPATSATLMRGTAGNEGTTGDAVVADAKRYLGIPYKWGGTDPESGLDCSGLVQRVYADMGYDLPRVSGDQAKAGRPVASLAEAQPGDLIAFGSPVDHIGIYAGDGKMVVAPHTGDVVKVQSVYRTPTAIRRILPDAPTADAGVDGVPYGSLFAAAGARRGVAPSLLAAVAKAESGFDPTAVSPVGAQGLMQIMPSTAKGLGIDPGDPAQAVDGAARLLREYLDKYDGSPELALAAYNAGPGAVAKYGGVPPYAETQRYVRTVLAYQNQGGS